MPKMKPVILLPHNRKELGDLLIRLDGWLGTIVDAGIQEKPPIGAEREVTPIASQNLGTRGGRNRGHVKIAVEQAFVKKASWTVTELATTFQKNRGSIATTLNRLVRGGDIKRIAEGTYERVEHDNRRSVDQA